jgi:YHS domain-containing protein
MAGDYAFYLRDPQTGKKALLAVSNDLQESMSATKRGFLKEQLEQSYREAVEQTINIDYSDRKYAPEGNTKYYNLESPLNAWLRSILTASQVMEINTRKSKIHSSGRVGQPSFLDRKNRERLVMELLIDPSRLEIERLSWHGEAKYGSDEVVPYVDKSHIDAKYRVFWNDRQGKQKDYYFASESMAYQFVDDLLNPKDPTELPSDEAKLVEDGIRNIKQFSNLPPPEVVEMTRLDRTDYDERSWVAVSKDGSIGIYDDLADIDFQKLKPLAGGKLAFELRGEDTKDAMESTLSEGELVSSEIVKNGASILNDGTEVRFDLENSLSGILVENTDFNPDVNDGKSAYIDQQVLRVEYSPIRSFVKWVRDWKENLRFGNSHFESALDQLEKYENEMEKSQDRYSYRGIKDPMGQFDIWNSFHLGTLDKLMPFSSTYGVENIFLSGADPNYVMDTMLEAIESANQGLDNYRLLREADEKIKEHFEESAERAKKSNFGQSAKEKEMRNQDVFPFGNRGSPGVESIIGFARRNGIGRKVGLSGDPIIDENDIRDGFQKTEGIWNGYLKAKRYVRNIGGKTYYSNTPSNLVLWKSKQSAQRIAKLNRQNGWLVRTIKVNPYGSIEGDEGYWVNLVSPNNDAIKQATAKGLKNPSKKQQQLQRRLKMFKDGMFEEDRTFYRRK